jgi:uncharacterized RDD family membrane protein YckC
MYDGQQSIYIDTPENLTLEAEVAGFGSRFMAAFVDYAIIIITLGLLTLLFAQSFFSAEMQTSWAAAAYGFIVFLLVLFYHLVFEFFWNGQTPGKRRVGLRVVMNNGMPVTTSAAVTRNLVRLFDFLPLLYGFGLISMFATRHVQRLGDIAAGTIVVRERAGLSLQSLREDTTVEYYHINRMSQLDPRVNVEPLSPEDRRVLVGYLQRRANFDEEQRQRLSIGLARKLAYRMGVASARDTADLFPGVRSAETFLEQAARAFEMAERAEQQRRSRTEGGEVLSL